MEQVTHFAATYNENKQTGDWKSASKNAGVFFNVSFNTDLGYGTDKQNGVTQSEPVVKSKTVKEVKKDKGDDSFHPGQYLANFNQILDLIF